MAKRALITGITGQDGSYLAELLLENGYEVFGMIRRSSAPNVGRIEHLLDRVTLKPAETFKSVLPSKMFEAMAAGKPIVLAVEGEARDLLERAEAGLPVPPGNAVALARAVAQLAQRPALREQFGSSGCAFVAREFNRAVWADRYLDILADASHSSAAPSTFAVSPR